VDKCYDEVESIRPAGQEEEQRMSMTRSFTIVVERDPETNWLLGEVVELPGCYSQAPDLPSLEANMREAVAAYLQTVKPDEPLPDFVGTWKIEVAA
jgi:predicted RNase H-like HicB family nuclease